jgi:hypothetical protein
MVARVRWKTAQRWYEVALVRDLMSIIRLNSPALAGQL